MNQQRDLDPIIATWLDDGPIDLPADTRRAIVVGLRTQPRARRMAILRGLPVNPLNRFLAAAAIVLAVGGLSIFVLSNRGGGGPGAQPTPSPAVSTAPSPSVPPSASPSPDPLDTATWTPYVSNRYGFSIAHPADWTEVPADHDWTLAADVDWMTKGAEAFFTPVNEGVRMTAWSVAPEPGTTVDAWLQAYCPLTMVNTDDPADQCATVLSKAAPATMDGHGGLLVVFPTDTQAFFLVEERLYIVAIWRPETDQSVARYSGTRRLVETAISTMRLLPGGPAPASNSPAPS